METAVKEALQRLTVNPIRWDCPLSRYTSFAIGGPAEAVVKAADSRELAALLAFFAENRLKWQVIGKGTNLVVADAGFAGVIVLLGDGFAAIDQKEDADGLHVLVTAGSGCGLTGLSGRCAERGLAGLEFAWGIPGTVGGAVIMNAGAWGREMADVLTAVTLMTAEGPERVAREQMHFSYRSWQDYRPGADRRVVVGAEMRLVRDDAETIRRRCAEVMEKRRHTQPKGQPNAGSFFKNPPHDSAGRLIDKSGCKGLRVGGAMVSPVHANFFVNMGGATAADVLKLMDTVQTKVQRECGVFLEPEVHFL